MVVYTTLLAFVFTPIASAAEPFGPECPPGTRSLAQNTTSQDPFQDFKRPQEPSAPPPLARQIPSQVFAMCQRQFLYQGRYLPVDSKLARDAENLRSVLSDVPPALTKLDQYQKNRRTVRTLAYIGTAGLALATVGYIFGRDIAGDDSIRIRNLMLGGGLLVAGGSLFVGLTVLRTNERNLGQAAELYNQANPTTPIELQFTTGFVF